MLLGLVAHLLWLCVSSNGDYLSCFDPIMGMSVVGSVDDMKSFNFICSLMLSEDEEAALGATGAPVVSTLSEIVSEALNGATLEMILNSENNTLTLMINGTDTYKIIIDLTTGVVQDILNDQGVQLKGAETTCPAYCYHDQLTDNVVNVDSELLKTAENLAGGAAFAAGVLLAIAEGPELLTAAAIVLGVSLTLQSEGFFEDPYNPRIWVKSIVDLLVAGIPGGIEAKGLITIEKSPWVLGKNSVIYTGGKYVLTATLGGSTAEAIKNVGDDRPRFGENVSRNQTQIAVDKFRIDVRSQQYGRIDGNQYPDGVGAGVAAAHHHLISQIGQCS